MRLGSKHRRAAGSSGLSQIRFVKASRQSASRVAARFSWRASHDCFKLTQADRILRYIDGTERTIRYPAPTPVQSLSPSHLEDADSLDEEIGWHICGDHDVGCSMQPSAEFDQTLPGAAPTDTLWGEHLPVPCSDDSDQRTDHDALPVSGLAGLPLDDTVSAAHANSASAPLADVSALPDSPAELLRFLQSKDFKQKQKEEQARIDDSYTVMRECPWPVPKQLTVLALRQQGQEHPTMYTLPVSQSMDERHGRMSDIDKLIGSSYLAHNISVQVMRNGAVAFEDEADAQTFRDHLEAEGHLEVLVSELDSHSLFRAMIEARSVVVLMQAGKQMPKPAQLAATLRQKQSLEEM